MDHIHPVVDPILGFVNFDTYIDRMFCEENGWQRLCNPCHDNKTQQEQAIRKVIKSTKPKIKRKKKIVD